MTAAAGAAGAARTAAAAAPRRDPIEAPSTFVTGAGFVPEETSAERVTGSIELGPAHHTPWGIVHGGVYCSAIETAASIGATTAVLDRGQVAVGLTNTTNFLRALSEGRVRVEAVALYQGRIHQLWRADITDPSGRLVAHGEVRLQNVDAVPDHPGH